MRRTSARTALIGVGLGLGVPACGDAMLPSDYTGKPAGEVLGNIVAGAPGAEAQRPLLSIEWLTTLDPEAAAPAALRGQLASLQRSTKLEVAWEIGLGVPTDDLQLEQELAQRNVRFAVAKMVYFDDLVDDGRLDWSCVGGACDRVKSISGQYVVYVTSPPYCSRDG